MDGPKAGVYRVACGAAIRDMSDSQSGSRVPPEMTTNPNSVSSLVFSFPGAGSPMLICGTLDEWKGISEKLARALLA